MPFTRLVRNSIKALTSGQSLTEQGITVVRTATGDLRWSVNIMVDGQRIHRVIGLESEGVTRGATERAIEALRTQARENRLNLPKGRKVRQTFADAAGEYVTRLEASGGKNLPIKKRQLRMYLIPALGGERIDKITELGLQRYRKNRRDTGASAATVNREMATLSHFFRSAIEWRWIAAAEIPRIQMETEPRRAITVLSHEQSEALLRSAIEDHDDRLALFVAFGLNTAMRHREILSVRYDQIDFSNRRIFIPSAKAGQRDQPITSALADALELRRINEVDPDGWVFPSLLASQSKAGHRTNMARPFQRAVVRAGLDPKSATPHTMRHTAITRLVKAGTDLPTIQKISGHKTLSMVLRYSHVHGSHIDDAIDALSTPCAI